MIGSKKVVSVFVILAMVIVLLSACTGSKDTGQSAEENTPQAQPSSSTQPKESDDAKQPATTEPTEISVMTIQYSPEALPDDNPVKLEIEKRTNTKLKINWVSANTYAEKTQLTLASGEIPDLMLITNNFDPQFRQMALQGAFWDIAPYIKDYQNLAGFPQQVWDNSKINGKTYGIVRPRPLYGGGSMPMIRKDWLDHLGMKMPETMEEMYEVAKAFTEKDPDGNKQADTTGLSGYVSVDGMGDFSWVENVFNNTTGAWKLVDGKLVPTVFEKGTRDALIWLNRAYNEKLMVGDFAVLKRSQGADIISNGKAGIIGSEMNRQWVFTEAIRKQTPDGDMYPIPYMIGPDGKYAPQDPGIFGMYVIPKKVPEDKMKKILQFMDYGASDEGSDLASYGIEGVHYTIEDGFKVATPQAEKDMVAQYILGQILGKYDQYQRAFVAGMPKDLYERNMQVLDEMSKYGVPDPSYGTISETEQKVGPDYSKKIQDLKVKVILGKEPISAWDDFVNKLKNDSQYNKIIQEKNEAYAQNK